MVKSGGRGNGEIVALVAVPLRVDTVQCETHDGQNVCRDGGTGPGGIDFTGGHILDVVPVWNVVIGGG